MSLIERVEWGLGRLHDLLLGAFAVAIALISILIPLNLALARMQLGSIWWLHEAVEYALYVGVFLAAPWVLRQGAHIKADVISANLPQSAAHYLDKAIDLLGAIVSFTLCVYAVRATIWEFQDYTYPPKDLRIANWYMMAVFSTSFFLCTIEFLLAFGRSSKDTDDRSKEQGMLGG